MNPDPKVAAFEALCRSVLETPGSTDRAARDDAFAGRTADAPWDGYVAKVRDSSYRIGVRDIEHLLAAGIDEDAIFELTVAAAVGAGARRMAAGLRDLSTEG